MWYGLTPLGVVHTAISIVAVAAGFTALVRDRRISSNNGLGKLYVITTALTCLTGFGIFQHGGFNKAHGLGIITLVVLAAAWAAGRYGWFGRASRYVESIGYSATLLFHMIPAVAETTTRLPFGAPLLASPEAPELQTASAVLLAVFLLGAGLQFRALRASRTM